jgi:hypothetical protein
VRPRYRGRVWVIAASTDGRVSTRRLSLPAAAVQARPVRRRNGVFNDEVGAESVSRSYRQVVRRFGPPAREATEDGRRCAYYEVVGHARARASALTPGG